MSFKDKVAADNHKVFLHTGKFAALRTVKYDGKTYEDIPTVLSGFKEGVRARRDKRAPVTDHAQGLYQVTSVLLCAITDLDGKKPEKGKRIKINDRKGGGGFFHEFYVASSVCEMGMLRVELEEIDE